MKYMELQDAEQGYRYWLDWYLKLDIISCADVVYDARQGFCTLQIISFHQSITHTS